MPRGGRQPGAGRPKGSKNKRTIALEEAIAEGGELPKGFMLRVMRDEEPADAASRRHGQSRCAVFSPEAQRRRAHEVRTMGLSSFS